jgi:hypothetical protein
VGRGAKEKDLTRLVLATLYKKPPVPKEEADEKRAESGPGYAYAGAPALYHEQERIERDRLVGYPIKGLLVNAREAGGWNLCRSLLPAW